MTKRLSIGTGVSAFIVALGIALSLSDNLRNETLARVLIIGASLYLAVCVVVAAWRRWAPSFAARRQAQIDEGVQRALREQLVRKVRPWVREDVQRAIAEQKDGGQMLAAMLADATPESPTQRMGEAALRLALNELSEELEYILDRIAEDEPGYWRRCELPNLKWVAHGSLLGSTDTRGHEALRAAYREADRINHCLHNQARRYDEEGNLLDGPSVEDCEPERYEIACRNAIVEIKRMHGELATGR